jgi:chemotaxis protein MotB
MARKGKTKEPEKTGGESGTSRWMLTYLDMVTLLFGVFVLMYAMSNVDKGKAEAVSESLREAFQGGMTTFSGPRTGGQTILKNLDPVGSMKKTVYENIRRLLTKEIERNIIVVKETRRGLRISFASDIFFESGSATLSGDMAEVLGKIAPVLKDISSPIVIAGHTDDVPVHLRPDENRHFRDNWELAAMRAIHTLRYLESEGVDPSNMSIQSYGKYQPIDSDLQYSQKDTPENRSLNRRVDILIETDRSKHQPNDDLRWRK